MGLWERSQSRGRPNLDGKTYEAFRNLNTRIVLREYPKLISRAPEFLFEFLTDTISLSRRRS